MQYTLLGLLKQYAKLLYVMNMINYTILRGTTKNHEIIANITSTGSERVYGDGGEDSMEEKGYLRSCWYIIGFLL